MRALCNLHRVPCKGPTEWMPSSLSRRASKVTLLVPVQHKWLQQQGAAPDTPMDNVVISRMRRFAAMNKLKKAALLVIARSMNQEQIQGLKELFQSIDADNSGTITVEELRDALADMGNHVTVALPPSRRSPARLPAPSPGWLLVTCECLLLHAERRWLQDSELTAVMSAADLDQNGELCSLLHCVKLTHQSGGYVLHPAVSVTGTIDYEEFIAATVNLNRLEQEAAYQAAFQTFDTDGSGCLSVEEIGSALKVRSSCLLLGRPVGPYSSLYQATF